jgi:hypothetical protein
MDYAFAQSVLFKICGNSLQETGHLTKGHVSLTESDREISSQGKCSLLYGELLPRGANKAMEKERLDCGSAQTLFDLGMGTGKIVLQAFLQFPSLLYCYGVELSEGRYRLAEEAVIRMVELLGADRFQIRMVPGKFIVVTEVITTESLEARDGNANGSSNDNNRDLNDDGIDNADSISVGADKDKNSGTTNGNHNGNRDDSDEALAGPSATDSQRSKISSRTRVLHFQCGDMFECVQNIQIADIVMMETDVPLELYPQLHVMLSNLHVGARVLSYLDFYKCSLTERMPALIGLRQLMVNRLVNDRYPTSWSVQRGHHFYLWEQVNN